MREEFEAWAKLRRYSLICEDDEYLQRETKIAWSAWQGAVAWEREEWQGLTDEEIAEVFGLTGYDTMAIENARAIEAALKERNT